MTTQEARRSASRKFRRLTSGEIELLQSVGSVPGWKARSEATCCWHLDLHAADAADADVRISSLTDVPLKRRSTND